MNEISAIEHFKKKKKEMRSNNVFVAQWIAHQTSNLGVVGSSPTVDFIFMTLKLTYEFLINMFICIVLDIRGIKL